MHVFDYAMRCGERMQIGGGGEWGRTYGNRKRGFISMQAFAYMYFLIYLLFRELLTINANVCNQ